MSQKRNIFLVFLVVLGSCKTKFESNFETSVPFSRQSACDAEGQGLSQLAIQYPISPQVHLSDSRLDASRPGTVSSSILNVVAYARELLRKIDESKTPPADPDAIARDIARVARNSGLSDEEILSFYRQVADAKELEAKRQEELRGSEGLAPTTPLSTLGKRIGEAQYQLDACNAKGFTGKNCCEAMALPWSFLDLSSKWSEAERLQWESAAKAGKFYESVAEQSLAREQDLLRSGAKKQIQPFDHQGIKAWLAVCAPIVTKAPIDLRELRARYGDYRKDRCWQIELHPISLAKLGPRRIYRNPSRGLSVAESLNSECQVRETEVIVRRTQDLAFWTYGEEGKLQKHGFFPARKGVDAIKYTPDACMGCHYRLDSRDFDVFAPSYVALDLKLREAGGNAVWVDGSKCSQKGETVIWHQRPE